MWYGKFDNGYNIVHHRILPPQGSGRLYCFFPVVHHDRLPGSDNHCVCNRRLP
ncbi:hypothetical protein FOQG_18280 [Fusarium oxysporum f. sp. raphani 54005]|uniref:Uncharacterized protein n=1 Tax=Fusarium oxysporum f. sp. raphani 54005 TaxID=1089458 RepID=X0C2I2_FUSOX|nr:hypothetical protein FOQG_18280 [Fusarium oxysporum f. sp. raphani 54005]